MGHVAYGWVSLTSMRGGCKAAQTNSRPCERGCAHGECGGSRKKKLCAFLCMCLERSVEAQRGDTHSVHISTYNKLQSRTALGGEEVGSQNGKTSKPAVIADCGQL